MATLANVQIADKDSSFDSGAAFLLVQKSDVDKTIRISADREVEVCKHSPYVVARIKGASNASTASNQSYETVQQALDILSAQGAVHLTTRDTQDESLLWWRGSLGQVLRIISVLPMSFTFELGRIVVTDQDGNVRPESPPPEITYHESLRYFRLSQATDSLFDAFRNMYLAFESLLGIVVPYQRPPEGTWLRNALAAVNNQIPLAGVFGSTPANVVDDIFQQIYEEIRCQIFHSKGTAHLVPQNLAVRNMVDERLKKLSGLVVLLMRDLLHVHFPSGGVTYEGFNLMTESILKNSTIRVSDSDLPADQDDTLDSPAYKNAVELRTNLMPDLSEPGLNFILGAVPYTDLGRLSRIGRLSVIANGKPGITVKLDAELKHPGIDVLEAQVGLQLRNVRQPKHLYRS